ncbi:hypothetical protein HDU80_001282 [Chytriomyces hyalinus]|nr:hypothetical protein HDU80_001282 [Chytriomyces hyalinus]
MSSVSFSDAAPTATMDLAVETDMGTMIMDETAVSTVGSAVPTGAPAAGAGGATFAALEEALPPCAISCVTQYTSVEAACAAADIIQACGAAACTGPDLARFDTFLATVGPICEDVVAVVSTRGSAATGAPRSAGNAATGTASAAVKTNGTSGTKTGGNSAAATGTATKAATTAAKNSSASMMHVFGLFASAVALLVL